MTTPWRTAHGTLRYSPEIRPGQRTRRDGGTTEWWLILDVDPQLGRWLRYQYHTWHRLTRKLSAPLWGPHISIVRGEIPLNLTHWKAHENREIAFEYDPHWLQIDDYVWCDARSVELEHLRTELGLKPQPEWPFHLSFGNLIRE
ncbi:MAG: hypothetical protein ACRC8S_13225 [Fimbriiglobus sp.]